jgi:hypothetical protein
VRAASLGWESFFMRIFRAQIFTHQIRHAGGAI